MKDIYKYYKERLIEISGKNRSLFSKKISKKYSYDIGKLLDGNYEEIENFLDFLWRGRRGQYVLMDKKHKDLIYKNFDVEKRISVGFRDMKGQTATEISSENARREKLKKDEIKKIIAGEVSLLKNLKREIEEFAKETGRYEMFVGYPFVEGALGTEMVIKAPLLLFPVIINVEDEKVSLEMKTGDPVQLNKVFILAYAKHYRINMEEVNLEFNNLLDYKLKNIDSVLQYLKAAGITRIGHSVRKGLFNFERGSEPRLNDSLEIKYHAVIGRFPLANAIYNDYNALEKKKLTTTAITELLESKKSVPLRHANNNTYMISSLDYAQENAIESINKFGNIVIYGPPGTGKSQTIANIITDAMCKGRRVLVVSQKKAALDVVYNRLGVLNNKAMYVSDAEKGKAAFYERIKNAHLDTLNAGIKGDDGLRYNSVDGSIKQEVNLLQTLSDVLFTKTSFGLNLQQMYSSSYLIGKNSLENNIYEAMKENKPLLELKHEDISNAVRIIKEKRKSELYYKHIELQKENPLIDHIRTDLDVHALNNAKNLIAKLKNKRIAPFDIGRYPNTRQLLAFYLENGIEDVEELRPIVKYIVNVENPKLKAALRASVATVLGLVVYPFFKVRMNKKIRQVEADFIKTLKLAKEHTKQFEGLKEVLDDRGWAMLLGNILNGNMLFLEFLGYALDSYITIRDLSTNIRDISEKEMMLLNFAYENSSNLRGFKEVIDKIVTIRIYYEIVLNEEKYKTQLSKIMDYENIKDRIASLKNEKESIVKEMCLNKFKKEYADLYNSNPNNKNFFYQISKPQNLWPIRKLMETYEELLLKLFPCWILSPESVSTIMPLKKELFDLVLFDEASQIFVENTLPTIFRGKYIAIAGDNKQLRPTATFIKRYMGSDADDDRDLNTQVALEVESLLDLATARYNTANLTYHYRSKNEELINFSNYAFYEGRLQVAPNITKNIGSKPIEVIKVAGKWIGNRNHAEALKIVELLKRVFKTRKNKETIGIITFNAEQEAHVEDLLDEEADRNPAFKNAYMHELNRKEKGEDVSLFIKNLENVQGDERDIIIFSIGYARNEYGKVSAHFGPLNLEGGENRLNVAITRAKQKIYIVTSIEPEELVVEGTKNLGPKLFKKYLQYARAVSYGRNKEVKLILEGLKQTNLTSGGAALGFEEEIKSKLEQMGYTVDTNLGNNTYKLTLAIFDKTIDRYILGVECDYSAFLASDSIMERDVFRAKFMESRGWKIMRVFSRDYFLSPTRVINSIAKAADKNKEVILKEIAEQKRRPKISFKK